MKGLMTPEMADGQEPVGQQQASPEEQEQYDLLVSNALRLMAPDGELNKAVVQRLAATGDPVADAGNTISMVMQRVVSSAMESGMNFSGDVLLHAGKEVAEHVIELAEAAGVHDFSEEEMEGAFFRAVDEFRQWATMNKVINDEPLKEEFGRILEADKQGRLNEIVPGIDEYARKRGKPAMDADEAAPMQGGEAGGLMGRRGNVRP